MTKKQNQASSSAPSHQMSPFHWVLATIFAVGATTAISQQPAVQAPTSTPSVQSPSGFGQPIPGQGEPGQPSPQQIAAAVFPNMGSGSGKNGPSTRVGAAGEIIGFTDSDGSGSQTITLVHTGKSWMAVYHIDRAGTIRLVSSRPIDADFSLQLNATSPLPREIRELTGKK